MTRSVAGSIVYGVVALVAAGAIPAHFMAADPWLEASRAIRAVARADDVVILVPGSRVDRLAAFEGLRAAAADAPVPPESIAPFRRVFLVYNGNVPPPIGLVPACSQSFGNVTIELLTRSATDENPPLTRPSPSGCGR